MANIRNQSIDKTHISADTAEERIILHRDVIAHSLRWSHIAKFLHGNQRYKDAHILDIGCGREVPLAKMLYSNRLIPSNGSYTGVDYNKISLPAMLEPATNRFKITLIGNAAFPDVALPRDYYGTIVCFEVLEHVEPAHSFRMLKGIRGLLADEGRAFISTPCYDDHVGAAANHVNEMSYLALGAMIEAAGLSVVNVWGTFASQKDYKHALSPEERRLFEKLSEYYDSNYLSTIFAPLFPDKARNCLWELRYADIGDVRSFEPLSAFTSDCHSSSARWADFVGNFR